MLVGFCGCKDITVIVMQIVKSRVRIAAIVGMIWRGACSNWSELSFSKGIIRLPE